MLTLMEKNLDQITASEFALLPDGTHAIEFITPKAAPSLTVTPTLSFTDRDGLGFKLDQIGSKLSIDQTLRDTIDSDIRAHRNELAHGRSLVARVPFDQSKDLMFEYLRNLR